MFYYNRIVPTKGSIVVATFDLSESSETCIYVTLTEYNNCRGILYRNELPKRLKLQKKAIIDMKRASDIVCVVTNSPKIDSEGRPELVELSIKGVDQKYHDDVITRVRTVEKILKIFKFVAIKFGLSFDDITKTVKTNTVVPFSEIDEDDGVDTLTNFYTDLLRNPARIVSLMHVDPQVGSEIEKTLCEMIKETNASTSMCFDIAVWRRDSKGSDPMYVLRSLFTAVSESFREKTVELRYLGAPRYQIDIKSIHIDSIDQMYDDVHKAIVGWLADNGVPVNGYDFKYDTSSKIVQRGDVTIAYPFHVEIK